MIIETIDQPAFIDAIKIIQIIDIDKDSSDKTIRISILVDQNNVLKLWIKETDYRPLLEAINKEQMEARKWEFTYPVQ